MYQCISHSCKKCSFSKCQAETSEDLYEWKTALEHALAQAPSAALIVNGIFRGDTNDSIDGSFNQCLYFLLEIFLLISVNLL